MRAEVQHRLGIYGGAAQYLFETLLRENLIEQRFFSLGKTRYALFFLTEPGKQELERLGVQSKPSEWDILVQCHNAEEYSQHAFAILLFAYHARRRGWQVEICPEVDSKVFVPDVLITKDSERVYVEVEVLRHPKRRRDGADNTWVRKWRNQWLFQRRVAVATLTPARRAGIVAYLRPRHPGMATDLATLAKNPDCDLWVERWP